MNPEQELQSWRPALAERYGREYINKAGKDSGRSEKTAKIVKPLFLLAGICMGGTLLVTCFLGFATFMTAGSIGMMLGTLPIAAISVVMNIAHNKDVKDATKKFDADLRNGTLLARYNEEVLAPKAAEASRLSESLKNAEKTIEMNGLTRRFNNPAARLRDRVIRMLLKPLSGAFKR